LLLAICVISATTSNYLPEVGKRESL
jgi:hypothetical protein